MAGIESQAPALLGCGVPEPIPEGEENAGWEAKRDRMALRWSLTFKALKKSVVVSWRGTLARKARLRWRVLLVRTAVSMLRASLW